MKTIFYIGMSIYVILCISSMYTKAKNEKKRKAQRQDMPPLYARYFADNGNGGDDDDECPF